MIETVKRWVPLTYEAYLEHVEGGARISASGLAVVRRMIDGETVAQEESGLSKREWRELMEILGQSG